MRLSRRTAISSLALAPLLKPSHLLAQEGTAVAVSHASSEATALSLLDSIPGGKLDGVLDCTWLDMDRQIHALAGTVDLSEDERFRLISGSRFSRYPDFMAVVLLIEDLMGFGLGDIVWTASSGRLTDVVQIVRLRSSAHDLVPFWEDVEYEQRENEYGPFWTIGEDGDFDFDHPVKKLMLAKFNNIALLNDDTIALSPTAEYLGEVVAAHQESIPNKSAELATINVGLPADSASAWYLDSDILAMPEESAELLAESDAAVGPMPPMRTLCVGTTAGLSGDEELNQDNASEFLLLELDEAGTARQVIDVATWRVENMSSLKVSVPYSGLLEGMQAEIVNDHVVRFSLGGEQAQAIRFSNLLNAVDILPFMFLPEQ